MPKSLLKIALLSVLSMQVACAMEPTKPMAPPPSGCHVVMRHRFSRHPMIPMLLPLAEMRSYSLHLSDHEVSTLAVWHNRHMRIAVPLMKLVRKDKDTLHAALLRGASRKTVQELVKRLEHDHMQLLGLEVAQVRIVRKTLSSAQWDKLVRMYHHMPPMRFMMMHR